MIHEERIQRLNDTATRAGAFVLYGMEASCRAECNHALEYAVREANRLALPLLVGFGLDADSPAASARHTTFLLEGLRDVAGALARRGIPLIVRSGAPAAVIGELAGEAALVVTDRGYLRAQRRWRKRLAARLDCPLVQVEADVVVPVETACDREAYSAAVLRPRIRSRAVEFLKPLRRSSLRRDPPARLPASLALDDIPALVKELGVDPRVPPVPGVTGGPAAAGRRLRRFLDRGLRRYHLDRNDPSRDGQSGLGPYLRYGHLSPLQIALAVRLRRGPGVAAFLEELVVRRELSRNFTHYHPRYDSIACLPVWCRATLEQHSGDPRPWRYSPRQLAEGRTHDPYWNAAQLEMVISGTMHGYMRMYWGKKLLEWSPAPAAAFALALRLNDRYQLDGRDPNGFAGVAWCFGKHDRPWPERPIYGVVRSMTDRGLRRKFDVDGYVKRIEALRRQAAADSGVPGA